MKPRLGVTMTHEELVAEFTAHTGMLVTKVEANTDRCDAGFRAQLTNTHCCVRVSWVSGGYYTIVVYSAAADAEGWGLTIAEAWDEAKDDATKLLRDAKTVMEVFDE